MMSLALVLLLSAAPQQSPEARKIPDDSVEVVTRGCLKGRVFTATRRPEDEGVTKGPDVTGKHFRVAAKGDVMDMVKKYDGQLVEVVGIILKSALSDQGMGVNIGGSRVMIGAPGGDPTRMSPRSMPMGGVPTMDVSSVRFLSDVCPIG